MLLTSLDGVDPGNTVGVCFTGHRRFSEGEKADAEKKLDLLIGMLTGSRSGFAARRFFTGGALGFDTLAAEAVLRARERLKNETGARAVTLELLLPCEGQDRYWPETDREAYRRIISLADSVRVFAPHYFNGCMQIRDRALVDSADLCIAWLRPDETDGGTVYTVRHALKTGTPVLDLFHFDLSSGV